MDDTGQCVVVNGLGILVVEVVQGDGWCRAQAEDLGQGASFSYRVSARRPVTVGGQQVWQRDIVSTGLARGVQRRTATTLNAPRGTPLFVAGVFSDLDLNMWNSSQINSNVRSNGNVSLNNSAFICGSVMVGPAKTMTGGPSCSGGLTQATEPFVLSSVTVPAANDNARIGNGLDPKSGSVAWNAGTRVLTIDGGTLTLRGSNYSFCSLHLTKDARLIIEDDGTPVKIYIDAPESCTTGDPSPGSVLMEKKGRIDTLGPASLAQMYMAGSNTIATTLDFENNEKVGVEMALYAPRSTFSIRNYGYLIGGVVAKQVSLQNNSEIKYDSSVAGIGSETVPLQMYRRQSWVECTTAGGAAPNSNC